MTDKLLKFTFHNAPVRGEVVRLEEAWQAMIEHHGYPAPVMRLLGEMTAAAALLASNIKFSGSPPSGWKVTFQPESISELAPKQKQEVTALLTPSSKAIAGDYMVTLTASGDGASRNSDFRVTVETSTMWGIVGLVVIAAAVVVLSLAVMRFGRR